MSSAFSPSPSDSYEVIPRSPRRNAARRRGPGAEGDAHHETKPRKRWPEELRVAAVELSRAKGVSKAITILQRDPNFTGLCPSTLHYWIKASENQGRGKRA